MPVRAPLLGVQVSYLRRDSSGSEATRDRLEPLARAREWRRLLDDGRFQSRADLARQVGVSRAAVTQALRRLDEASAPGASDG